MIARGEKTVEVRKTRPKIDPPFRCYIYCTVSRITAKERDRNPYTDLRGKVIGEFVCDRIDHFDSDFDEWARSCAPPGSIIDSMGWTKFNDIIANEALLTDDEINDYFPENIDAWLWHISDLVIYNQPKPLRAFMKKPCDFAASCGACVHSRWSEEDFSKFVGCSFDVKRPPQSWCYVEENSK